MKWFWVLIFLLAGLAGQVLLPSESVGQDLLSCEESVDSIPSAKLLKPINVNANSEPPLVHAGNYAQTDGVKNFIGRILDIPKNLRFAPAMVLRLADETNGLQVDTVNPGGDLVSARTLLGYKRCFKILDVAGVRRVMVELGQDQCSLALEKSRSPFLREPERNFSFKHHSIEDLTSLLTATQEHGSHRSISADTREAREVQVRAGNKKILEILFSDRNLTQEILEEIDLEVVRGLGSGVGYLLAGIVRGTPPRVVIREGKTYHVDMRGLQMSAGKEAHFIPASEVPGKLAALLAKINAIDGRSGFRDIVSYYRDFLLIHPFTEGNGRVARILMDYMLVKAGFPPAPHSILTRDVLYYTAEETHLGFLRAFSFGRD